MVKKKTFVISLIIFVLVIILLNFASVYFFSLPLSPVALTGKAVDVGYVRLYIEGVEKIITIYSPENITYDNTSYTCATGILPKCNNYRYILPLNVSADFYLENDSAWKYSLYDLKHGVYIGEDVPFTPNTSIPFVRWGNLLSVFAEEEDADWINESVVFTIDVPNSDPLIQNLSDKIFVCEGQTINTLSESYFNVWDIDEEDFSVRDVDYVIDGEGVFGILSMEKTSNYITPLHIISVPFGKSHLTSYIKEITVYDSERSDDSKIINITGIEVNNAPVITNPEDFGSETIWMSGEDSVFSRQLIVSDTEDGGSNDGNLIFNLTGQLEFVFDSSTGTISYIPQEGDEEKTYSGEICVTDRGLSSVHKNFSICSDRGYTSESISVCDSFTLTITNENRAPSIDSYSPVLTSFTIPGTTENLFSVEVSDADMSEGFYPDIDWYVDGVLVESNENIATDDFSYTFGCGVSGVHNVTIVTSDGPANDSVTWNINVTNVDCPVEVERSSGGGGGGGGTLGGVCNEQWSCLTWGLCQNAERSFDAGILSPEDYASTKDMCAQNMYDDRFCGFQITKCFDLNLCNNSEIRVPKPVESRVCYFTENPNCIDGITNCHDGGCELLVDCGGPCDACPTCSDGKRNQGENGIDCGGPCPYACEAESAFGSISILLILLFVILVIVAIFIIWKFISILRYRFFLSGKKKKR